MQKIFFDNASTTPLLPQVIETMTQTLSSTYGNPSSLHSHGRTARMLIEKARRSVASILNAHPSEIIFTSSATESNNTVLKNCVNHLNIKHIISSPTEHPSVLRTLEYLEKTQGVTVDYLPVDAQGHIDYGVLDSILGNNTSSLVSLMHANNEIGTIHDIGRIGSIAKEHKALFHCDAVQTMGKIKLDTQALQIDFLTGSAHKFRGPKGAGILYKSRDTNLASWLHGGTQERNMRAGTENTAAIAGLTVALKYAVDRQDAIHAHTLKLKGYMQNQLQKFIPDIEFLGGIEATCVPHILSVSFPEGKYGDTLLSNLDILGISASSGSACSAGIAEDSHVLTAIGHPKQRTAIRFSFGEQNTLSEIDFAVSTIRDLIKTS